MTTAPHGAWDINDVYHMVKKRTLQYLDPSPTPCAAATTSRMVPAFAPKSVTQGAQTGEVGGAIPPIRQPSTGIALPGRNQKRPPTMAHAPPCPATDGRQTPADHRISAPCHGGRTHDRPGKRQS